MASYAFYCSVLLLICFEFASASGENSFEDTSEKTFWEACNPYFEEISNTYQEMVNKGTVQECYYDMKEILGLKNLEEMEEEEKSVYLREKVESMTQKEKEFIAKCWADIRQEITKTVMPSKECKEKMDKIQGQ